MHTNKHTHLHTHTHTHTYIQTHTSLGLPVLPTWHQPSLVSACAYMCRMSEFFLKLQVAFAEHSLFSRALWQKRPIILRSLLIVARIHIVCRSHSTLQHTATHCNTLQHTSHRSYPPVRINVGCENWFHVCRTLEFISCAVFTAHFNTLRHTAAQCSML